LKTRLFFAYFVDQIQFKKYNRIFLAIHCVLFEATKPLLLYIYDARRALGERASLFNNLINERILAILGLCVN